MSTPQVVSGPPPAGHPIPQAVLEAAGAASVTGIWLNALGGLTYLVGQGEESYFAKWSPGNPPIAEADLSVEATKLRWAREFINVPKVLSFEQCRGGQLLITAALPGHSAVSDLGKSDPERSAFAVGAGLRQLHDALPVEDCPFSWDLETRIQHLPLQQQRAFLAQCPDLDLVVCHGDACLPNTLITEDFAFTAQVDLGQLGVADRWADLAIAAWSTEWNYGPGFEENVYAGYSIEPNEIKINFYRTVWDAT